MGVKTSRLLLLGAFAPLMLTAPGAKAIALGEIHASSRIGQILRAEIEVSEHPAERFDPGCLKLYRPSVAGDDLPWITTARLNYRREDGRGKLSVVSQSPIVDPVVHLAVRSECAGGTDRQYTLLLAGPSAAASSSAPGSSAEPARVAQMESGSGNKTERRADSGAARKQPLPIEPRPEARAAARTKDETSSLSLSEEISLRAPSSGLERDLFRLERRALDMRNDPLDDQQAMSNKLAWLEANVAELKRAAKQLEGGVAATLPATAAVGTAAAQTGAVPASTTTTPLAGAPAVDPGATANAAPAAPQPPAPRNLPKAAAWSDTADLDAWLIYGGLCVVLLLLLLLLVRRRRSASRQARSIESARAMLPTSTEADFSITEEEAAAMVTGRSVRGGRPRSALVPPASSPSASRPPAPLAAIPPATSPAPSPEPEIAGAAPALELAEIMLSFGRVSGAARTLEEYIAVLPQESVRPWIRLLQLYQRNGMRKEFEALTLKLNRNFNVEVLRWDDGRSNAELELVPLDPTRQKAVTLETIPRICERIVSLWGKPECVGYLEQLLRDNRDGQRSGFTLPVVEEIVFLIDLIANREVGHQLAQQP